MSNTPLTDEAEFTISLLFDKGMVTPADFARGLEVENNRLKEEIVRLRECVVFIATQKDKTGNWAVENAKLTLKDIKDGVYR